MPPRRPRDSAAALLPLSQPATTNKRHRSIGHSNGAALSQPSLSRSHRQSATVSPRLFTRPYSIYRVSMENFMIYTQKTIFPGPHLNLILGPNGSGKSTIVCAICLGLGGNHRSLGRMKELREFINTGNERCRIEIELHRPAKGEANNNLVIARVISADCKSHYELGEYNTSNTVKFRDSSAKEVHELMLANNIHVDNLCVLLAQNRVGSFSEMRPVEVLVEMEKAAKMELYHQHQQLIELRKQEKSSCVNLDEVRKQLENKERELEALQPEIERQQQRQGIVAKLTTLNHWKPWLKLREAESLMQSLIDDTKLAESEFCQQQSSQQPLIDARQRVKSQLDEAKKNQLRLENQLKIPVQEKQQHFDSLKAMTDNIGQYRETIRALRDQQSKHGQTLRDCQSKLDEQRQRVTMLPNDSEIEANKQSALAEFNRLKAENNQHQRKMTQYNEAISEMKHEILSMENRIRNKSDLERSRIEKLFRLMNDRQCEQEWRMIQELLRKQQHVRNKGNERSPSMNDPSSSDYVLKGPLYGPIVLELDYQRPNMGVVLENSLNNRLKFTYVCSEQDDALFLTKNKLRWSTHQNPSVVPSVMTNHYKSTQRVDLSQLAQYGNFYWAIDELQCQELVMKFLYENTPLPKIIVSDRELTSQSIEAIFITNSHGGGRAIDVLYTPSYQFNQRISRYGDRARSLTDRANQPVRLFAPKQNSDSSDDSEHAELHLQIAARKSELSAKEREMQDLQVTNQDWSRRNNSNSLERTKWESAFRTNQLEKNKLRSLERELQSLQTQTNYDGKVEEAKKIIIQLLDKQLKMTALLTQAQKKFDTLQSQSITATIIAAQRAEEFQYLDSRLNLFQSSLQSAMQRLQESKDKLKKHVESVKQLKRQAEQAGSLAELQDTAQLPQSLAQCEDEIEQCETSLEAMRIDGTSGQTLQARYDRLTDEVATLRARTESQSTVAEQRSTEIESLKTDWLSGLTALIDSINHRFAYYMARIDCLGHVSLQSNNNDFDQYALLIEVSFRNTEALKVLSSDSQSGGEKSVSTMLFLLSLQHVTDAPFRIVDEINQGMDPDNERAVFDQIVHASTHTDADTDGDSGMAATPQYIVVTPKLLPRLSMPEPSGISCICVWGGNYADTADTDARADNVSSSQSSSRGFSQSQSRLSWSQHSALPGRLSEGVVDEASPVSRWDSIDQTIAKSSEWHEMD